MATGNGRGIRHAEESDVDCHAARFPIKFFSALEPLSVWRGTQTQGEHHSPNCNSESGGPSPASDGYCTTPPPPPPHYCATTAPLLRTTLALPDTRP